MSRTKSAKYEVQFSRTQANKVRKLEKHILNHPKDKLGPPALEFWKTVGRRKKH